MRLLKYIFIFSLLSQAGCNPITPLSPATGTAPEGSTLIYAQNKSPIAPAVFQQGIADINWQLSTQFYPAWGINATVVQGEGSPSVTIFADRIPGSPATESCASSSWAYIGYTVSQKVNSDGHEQIRCMSHEIINLLMQRSKKSTSNLSITDCCGGNSYSPTGKGPDNLSDFAYPSFCKPDGKAPYDVCKFLTSPLTPLPGHKLIYLVNVTQ